MKIKNCLTFLFLITLAPLFGQNFNDVLRLSDQDILSNPLNLSMGNALLGSGLNSLGTLVNPASIALSKKTELSAGFNYNSFKNSSSFLNNNSDYSSTSSRFNQAGIIVPWPTYQGSFAISLGFERTKDFNKSFKFSGLNSTNSSLIQDMAWDNDDIVYDLGLSYPVYNAKDEWLYDETHINGKLKQSGNNKYEGALNNWYFGAAIEAAKDIFVGFNFSIYSGDFLMNRNYEEEDVNNVYTSSLVLNYKKPETTDFKSFSYKETIDWEISGWGLNLGLIAKLDESFNLGMSIKFPKKFSIQEKFNVNASSLFGSGAKFYTNPSNAYEYEISTPYEFGAGIAYDKGDFTINGDINLVDYSSSEFVAGLDRDARNKKNAQIKEFLKSVINLKAGAEYRIPDTRFAVRGGFMYLPSAFKDDDSSFDKKFITAGIGYELTPRFMLDVGYAYGWWKDFGDNASDSRVYHDATYSNIIMGIRMKM